MMLVVVCTDPTLVYSNRPVNDSITVENYPLLGSVGVVGEVEWDAHTTRLALGWSYRDGEDVAYKMRIGGGRGEEEKKKKKKRVLFPVILLVVLLSPAQSEPFAQRNIGI